MVHINGKNGEGTVGSRSAKVDEVRSQAEHPDLQSGADTVTDESADAGAGKSAEKTYLPAYIRGGLPGETRYSTIIGLAGSPSSKKWELFLRDGPYWNYLVNYIQKRNIFRGRRDRVDEAVMNTCEKIAKFMLSKRYKYPEEGKGYFRGFLKVVAFRTALELYRDISRQEQMHVTKSDAEEKPELDTIQHDMEKTTARHHKRLAQAKATQRIADKIPSPSERDLDVYDMSAGLNRKIAPAAEAQKTEVRGITRLDDNPFSDDEAPVNYNPADMFEFETKVSKEDLEWVRKLQIHVLYIALGYVLTNERVSVERREMLRLRYGLDMKVKDIYAMPRFASKSRNTLDVQMSRAIDELRKEAASWWKLAAPDKNDFADETVLKFWRELAGSNGRAKMAKVLHDKADKVVGRVK